MRSTIPDSRFIIHDSRIMHIALKYGLAITAVVIVWVAITHFVFPLPPNSKLNVVAPLLFNAAAIVAIYLGIKARKAQGETNFKAALKTGLSISVVYAISASLFFLVLLLIVGPSIMANEPMAENYSIAQLAIRAFIGMFFGSLILGLVYSTIIAFFLGKRLR
jgi:Na+/H+-translocating membrane pyrophosphatase